MRLRSKMADECVVYAHLQTAGSRYAFDTAEAGATQVHFPFSQMTEDDLFALFRPAGQTQGPKLREAIVQEVRRSARH